MRLFPGLAYRYRAYVEDVASRAGFSTGIAKFGTAFALEVVALLCMFPFFGVILALDAFGALPIHGDPFHYDVYSNFSAIGLWMIVRFAVSIVPVDRAAARKGFWVPAWTFAAFLFGPIAVGLVAARASRSKELA